MNHNQYKEWLHLLLYDELTTEERTSLDRHLQQCLECQAELKELKLLHSTLSKAGPIPIDEPMLRDARRNLRSALANQRARPSLVSQVSDFIDEFILPHYKVALGSVAMLVAGVFIGRLLYTSPKEQPEIALPASGKFLTSPEGDTRISNIHFIGSDARDGEVEFTFDAIAPVHMKGNINDERIQKVLAHALLNDDNPGVRLRTVNAFASQAQTLKRPDSEVKKSLIKAVKSDANPGVRKEALRVLKEFPFDGDIKQAFMFVLKNDRNPGLRIAAINCLDSLSPTGQTADPDILEVLKERMNSDANSYIRIRAKAALKEAHEQ